MIVPLRREAGRIEVSVGAAGIVSAPSASRARVVRVAVASASLMALYGAWRVSGWPSGHTELISDLSFVPLSLTAAFCAGAASRRCRDYPRLRSAWRLSALASLSYTVADLIWLLYAALGKSPYPSPADVFYLLFYPLMFVSLLRQPARRQSSRAAIRLGIDVAVVAIGGASVVAYVTLGPTLHQAGSHPLTTVFSLAYPVGDMILMLGLASVLLRGGPSIVLRLIALGLICFVAADLVYGYISLHGTYQSGNPTDALWMAAMAFFAVSAAAQARPAVVSEPAVQEIRSVSWLPYLALATTFGLLVRADRLGPVFPDLALVVACVLLTALVSARQFLTQQELLQARRELSHRSLHDGLTGLPNRLFLAHQAEVMFARAQRHGRGVAALYVDIDDFKAINDTYGHAVGDEALCAIGACLSNLVRINDVAGRLGGDEFVVLLDEIQEEGEARQIAARIGGQLTVPIRSEAVPGHELVVRASVGVVVTADGTFEELLHAADHAMYDVKRSRKRREAQFAAMPAIAR
jgi:diguanylate cyclase (GGDEF)-like protein